MSINDGGARPDTVALRLAQGVKADRGGRVDERRSSAGIRASQTAGRTAGMRPQRAQRIAGCSTPAAFEEFIGPAAREKSPHLRVFDLPEQFDDGMIVGRGMLDGRPVLLAAQEGRFMGGAFGEVHGAKLTGLLRAAAPGDRSSRADPVRYRRRPTAGGQCRRNGDRGDHAGQLDRGAAAGGVIGLMGGRAGCYGGGGLIAGCCSGLVVSEHGRISVSGPEVIETNKGVEEFDSKDRALVWRTMGGKSRRLLGIADAFVDDPIRELPGGGFGADGALAHAFVSFPRCTRSRTVLSGRLERFGGCSDAAAYPGRASGIGAPEKIPGPPTPTGFRRDRRSACWREP